MLHMTDKNKYKQMKRYVSIFFILIFLNLVSSCSPTSKESYIENYKQFIDNLSSNNNDYTEADWKRADKKMIKFTGEWYIKFEDEFTLQEQIVIKKYEVQYNLYKVKKSSIDFLEQL